jgi:2-dehydro-3-deoxyphosphogluconate aldolase/(4S)-4-hydroxy-2-oxoglutarate aldolase
MAVSFDDIAVHRIIPVVKIDSADAAEPLFDALQAGGLPLAEVTLRTPCAFEAIRIAARRPNFIIGAGTVLNVSECQMVLEAGASFVVSPGFDRGVVNLCQHQRIPCLPGVATATEIQTLFNLGVRAVKFFPAESLGGIPMLQALAAPFHQMKFVPTGGIGPSNLAAWLSLPRVAAVGGSWMVKPELYADGDFSTVTHAVREAVALVP